MMKIVIVLLIALVSSANAQILLNEPSQPQMVMTNLSSMPLAFTENLGQWNEKVLFKAESGGVTFWYCGDEVVYVFTRDTDELIEDDMTMAELPGKSDKPRHKKEQLVMKAQFLGANPDAEIIGADRLSHNNNYFIGNNSSEWRTDVPNYESIIYRDIYPGIDLKYHGNGKGMKYDFVVHPGADISQIQLRYGGVEDLAITPDGELEATTEFGPFHENIPSVYQESGSGKQEVAGRYVIRAPGVFGFEVDNYNPTQILVIDPELVYSTFLGGSGFEESRNIRVDDSGYAYVIGHTWSTDFPTLNPYQSDQIDIDAFVTKLSADGNSLVYSTYVGGDTADYGVDIDIDGSGHAYIVGYTYSTNFPTQNAYDASHNGYYDIFVTKLSPSGNSLDLSTYFGGASFDLGFGIAINSTEEIYITGRTSSSDFPTYNGYDLSWNGMFDAFAVKLSAAGNTLVYSTYLGGSSSDQGNDICVDSYGYAYITGETESANFPTPYAYDNSFNGSTDAFVTKMSSSGYSLIYSTFLGGIADDYGYGIAVNPYDMPYVTGSTESVNFPTANAYDENPNGLYDAFVTKFWVNGASIYFSTFLGGQLNDEGRAIALKNVDYNSDYIFITGTTYSSNFPTVDPFDATLGAPQDAFVTKFAGDAQSLDFSTYLGGNHNDHGYGIAVDDDDIYVCGLTTSSDFPTVNPYQTYQNGDAFVSKFGPDPTGACCYGDVANPSCNNELQSACEARTDFIEWTSGANCGTYTCPVAQTPQIVSITPEQNELAVAINTNISVTFDIDMDAATINGSTFLANGMCTGLHAGAITYNVPSKTATFNPVIDFAPGEIVTVVLTGDIESSAGVPLADYAWSFTTASAAAPGVFAAPSIYAADSSSISLFATDLDGDGDLDLATGNTLSDNVSVLMNNGDGTFAAPSAYATGDTPYSIFAADLDGDGDIDLATANVYSDDISVLLNNGDGTFAAQSVYATGSYPWSVFGADLDGDGDIDLATADEASDSISVLLNNGDGTFAAPSAYAVGNGPYSVFAADLDGDGDLDLTTANDYSYNVSVLLNNGDGTFAAQSVYAVGDGPYWVYAADLDGDGDLDLATANYSSGNVSVLLNNGNGIFAAQSVFATSGHPYWIFAGDLDGDGDLDLATTDVWSDNVSVLLNEDAGCDYVVGDVNGSGNYNGLDVTYGVAFLKGGNAPQCDPCPLCPDWSYCGDVNGSCNYNGLDITYGVAYLKGGSAPVACGDCPPIGGIVTAQKEQGSISPSKKTK